MIPSQRHLFDIPDDIAYFNNAYMSPLSNSVVAAGEIGLHKKRHPWGVVLDDLFAVVDDTRKVFADLINASAEDIAIVPAASYGTAVASANLPLKPGQNIVLLEEQFPSNVYPWHEKASECGADIICIPRPADENWTTALLQTINEKTGIVSLPHCHWTDGGLIDLVAVGARCREIGAALVVDATQSLGVLPFDVKAIQPDFMVTACYKSLMGPYSMGFMYAAPHRQSGRPIEYNWAQRADSQDFASMVSYRSELLPDASRYDMGERTNISLMPAAKSALEQITSWGVDNIQRTLRKRTDAIASRGRDMGLSCMAPDRRAAHFVGLRFADGVPEGLATQLADNKVFVSMRGSAVRITPHLYNTDADVNRMFDVLERVI